MKFSRLGLGIKIFFVLIALTFSIGISKWLKYVPQNRSGNHQIQFEEKNKVHLLVVGDTGTGGANQMAVAQAMEQYCLDHPNQLDGLLLLGDNIYKSGVKSVDDPQWKQKVELPYGSPCLNQIPIYPVFGNHDYRENPGAQVDYQQKNPRWVFPYRFYSVSWGKLLTLVGFDSAYPDFCLLPERCSVDFMRQELDRTQSKWKLVMAHHPLASASTKGYGHSGGIFGVLMKPFVCGKADFWLSGHSHHMEHRQEDQCETELIVAGSGGADLYDYHKDQPEVQFAAKKFGFFVLEASNSQIEFKFLNLKNKILYQSIKIKP